MTNIEFHEILPLYQFKSVYNNFSSANFITEVKNLFQIKINRQEALTI